MNSQMSDIIYAMTKAIPVLSESKRQFLLGYAEGVADMATGQRKTTKNVISNQGLDQIQIRIPDDVSPSGGSTPPPALPPAG